MANVKLKEFKADKAGYIELMNGSGMQALLDKEASAIKSRADGQMPVDSGYTHADSHAVGTVQGKLAVGRNVYTRNRMAHYQQARHKTLTKSIGG